MIKKKASVGHAVVALGLILLPIGSYAESSLKGGGSSPGAKAYNDGMALYQAGRFSDATEAFETAVKRRHRVDEAQRFIERIRRETVERIRNKALTGVSKTNWQTKYFYMSSIDDRIRVGISLQETFDPDSINFRPGAVEALQELARVLRRSENALIDIDLISEITQTGEVRDPEVTAQQLAVVFTYLANAARNQ